MITSFDTKDESLQEFPRIWYFDYAIECCQILESIMVQTQNMWMNSNSNSGFAIKLFSISYLKMFAWGEGGWQKGRMALGDIGKAI